MILVYVINTSWFCIEKINEHIVIPREKFSYLIQSFIHEYFMDQIHLFLLPNHNGKWCYSWRWMIRNNESRNYSMSIDRIIQINRSIIDNEFDDPMDKMKLNDYLNLFVMHYFVSIDGWKISRIHEKETTSWTWCETFRS